MSTPQRLRSIRRSPARPRTRLTRKAPPRSSPAEAGAEPGLCPLGLVLAPAKFLRGVKTHFPSSTPPFWNAKSPEASPSGEHLDLTLKENSADRRRSQP